MRTPREPFTSTASPDRTIPGAAWAAAALAVPDLVEPGDAVLVKASRGVELEAVVDALLRHFGEAKA